MSAGTDQHVANRVLQLMAKKNLKDTWYNARNLAISHYYAEKGERRNKDRVVKEGLSIEDATAWERVSKFSLSLLSSVHPTLHCPY